MVLLTIWAKPCRQIKVCPTGSDHAHEMIVGNQFIKGGREQAAQARRFTLYIEKLDCQGFYTGCDDRVWSWALQVVGTSSAMILASSSSLAGLQT